MNPLLSALTAAAPLPEDHPALYCTVWEVGYDLDSVWIIRDEDGNVDQAKVLVDGGFQ